MKRFLLAFIFSISFFCGFSQNFTPGNLVVSRYGNGIDNLPATNRMVPVFLDEFDLTGSKVQTLAMPIVRLEENRNRILTGNPKADYEGLLTLSPNGQYLVTAGHNMPLGKKYERKTHRTVAVITSDGHMNVRTAVRANIGLPRVAVTNNGINLWIGGSTGGLKYNTTGSICCGPYEALINRPPGSYNSLYIYNDQLYYTSDSGAGMPHIGVVGEGLPTKSSPTIKNLPGFPTTGKPGQMLMLDHDTSTPEPDLLYVSMQGESLQKWIFDGSTWEQQGALFIEGVTPLISGLTGQISDGDVVLYANTPSTILKFTDDQAITSDFEALNNPVVLATAPAETIFRGIAFTPGTTPKIAKKVSSSSEYANLIQEKTDLIRDIKENETYHPYPGIEETHLSYISNRGVPVALFFLKVNLKNPNATIEALTPYDDSEFARQKISDMIIYKNENNTERQVIAGSNGDYFHWTGEPDGAVHKNGDIIKELPNRKFFFGIRNDGTAIIGDKRIYDNVKTTLEEAISGRFFLMHHGEIMTDHLLDTSIEPRTTVGVLSPEHVVFMWVDGRRAGHSAGLSLRDMASIYKAIGATDAINLDGGGSTTFIMREEDGIYEPHNRPSDATGERSVANGLAVMMKKEILENSRGKEKNVRNAFVFPNPVENEFNIFIEDEQDNPHLTFDLMNPNGRKLLNINGSLNDINKEMNKYLLVLEPGIYIIKVNSGSKAYSSRFIKE